GDADAFVAFDLADRGPDDVDERHRPGGGLHVFDAGEDEEVLAVPAHDGGEVVQLEQGGEPVRVVLALLQALDDAQLAFDQAEGAQGEVAEGADDAGAQALQVGGRLGESGGVRVQGVDGADDLGELVVAAGEGDRVLGDRVLGPGEPCAAAAQHGQRAGQRAGHRGGDGDGDQHQGAEEGDPDLQGGDVVVAQLGEFLAALLVEGRLDAPHGLDAGGERGLELLGAGGEVAVGEGGGVGELREVLLGGVDLVAGDGGVVGGAGLLGGGLAESGEGGVGAQAGLDGGGGELVAPLGVGLRGDGGGGRRSGQGVEDGLFGARHAEGGEQQSAGGGGLLDGGVEFGEGVRAGAGARRGPVGQPLGEPVQFGDRGGVRLVRFESGALAGERRSAQGR